MQFFWEVIVRDFTEDLWIHNFRKKNAIGLLAAPAASCPRKSLSTNKSIAIAVYKLATCAEYRVVAVTFGVRETTVQWCVYGVCKGYMHKTYEAVHCFAKCAGGTTDCTMVTVFNVIQL